MTSMTMAISGMSCGHCVAQVTKALKGVDGVEVERVQVGSAAVRYDEGAATPATIIRSVEDAGYGARADAPAGT